MTFTASNSRIKVTDGTEVVIDTDENMPHIVGTQQISNVYVGFPNTSSYIAYWYTIAYYYIVNPPPTYQITSHYDMIYAGGVRAETGYYSSYYQRQILTMRVETDLIEEFQEYLFLYAENYLCGQINCIDRISGRLCNYRK